MRNLSLWLVVALVAVGGGYWWWVSQAAVPVASDASTELNTQMPLSDGENGNTPEPGVGEDEFNALVSYTGAGFEPSSLTIKRGDTVRFVNNANSGDTWPASAVHPTHSVYPEKKAGDCLGSSFDACRGLARGETWYFTFSQAGTWRYHDHLHPSKTGTIVVTE